MEETTGFDLNWLYTTLGTVGGTSLGFIARILFDKRKKVAEDNQAELDADTKAVDLYERFASQLTPRIEALQAKQDELVQNVSVLKLENAELKIENLKLKAENQSLKTDLEKLHTEIGDIKNSRNEKV